MQGCSVERGPAFFLGRVSSACAETFPMRLFRCLDLPMHNLLTDPTFRRMRSSELLTLPEVFARLAQGKEMEFSIQAIQLHPWHAFLVQTAALALAREKTVSFPTTPSAWAEALLGLTGGANEPWCLAVADPSKPAFFQPPTAGKDPTTWEAVPAVDALSPLKAKGRNHDVKNNTYANPRPEHWAYALSTYQTLSGYVRGWWGIARSNGGTGSRTGLAGAPEDTFGARFQRDVLVWLEQRSALIDTYGYRAQGGHGLLWLEPWDGETSFRLAECDPFFVEISRLVRLFDDRKGGFQATWTTTKTSRLVGKLHGWTGDVWSPTSPGKEGPVCLSTTRYGFSYRHLVEYLFDGSWTRSPAMVRRPEDRFFIARSLTGGQGKNEGFHERALPIPTDVDDAWWARIGEWTRDRVTDVQVVRRHVLFPALCVLVHGKTERETKALDGHFQRFEAAIDAEFFDYAFRSAREANVEYGVALFRSWVASVARRVFSEAEAHTSRSSTRGFAWSARASGLFYGGLRRRGFPLHIERPKNPEETHVESNP